MTIHVPIKLINTLTMLRLQIHVSIFLFIGCLNIHIQSSVVLFKKEHSNAEGCVHLELCVKECDDNVMQPPMPSGSSQFLEKPGDKTNKR